jgi:cytoskeletal protein RodZ
MSPSSITHRRSTSLFRKTVLTTMAAGVLGITFASLANAQTSTTQSGSSTTAAGASTSSAGTTGLGTTSAGTTSAGTTSVTGSTSAAGSTALPTASTTISAGGTTTLPSITTLAPPTTKASSGGATTTEALPTVDTTPGDPVPEGGVNAGLGGTASHRSNTNTLLGGVGFVVIVGGASILLIRRGKSAQQGA